MKPKSDLAALDALTDEELSRRDPENPEITAADLASGDWFRADGSEQLDAEIAKRLRLPGVADG